MTDELVTDRAEFELPYGRQATFKNVLYASDLRMLRLTLRENRRFTVIDLDCASAEALGTELLAWAREKSQDLSNGK